MYRLDDLLDLRGVSRRTIKRERAAGRFPRPDIHVGKAPLRTPEKIRRWIDRSGHR